MTAPERVVVKCGSSLITRRAAGVDMAFIRELARQVVALREAGCQVVLVISGAVAMGRGLVGDLVSRSVVSRQLLAAVGQAPLMQVFQEAFGELHVTVAQTLLSRAALEDRSGYLNARNTFLALLEHDILPVANENDVVATEELHFGDNDNLSALIANLVDADLLIMLTDVEGYFEISEDGHKRVLKQVDGITDDMLARAGGAGSESGTGGIKTKLEAARLANAHGAAAVVVDGRLPDVLARLHAGENPGTRFLATGARRESRKRWMLTDLSLRGRVFVDAGAAQALMTRGRSLLPTGVEVVEGNFGRGDLIAVVGPDGIEVAHGLANYDNEDTRKIAGRSSAEIEAILGYEYGEELVHRNNLVLVPAHSAARFKAPSGSVHEAG